MRREKIRNFPRYMVHLFLWYGVKDGVLDFATCGRSETGFAKTNNIMYQDLSIPAGLADQSQCSVNTSTIWVDTQIPACACLVTSTLHQHTHHHHRYQIVENFEEMLNFYGGRTSFPFFFHHSLPLWDKWIGQRGNNVHSLGVKMLFSTNDHEH